MNQRQTDANPSTSPTERPPERGHVAPKADIAPAEPASSKAAHNPANLIGLDYERDRDHLLYDGPPIIDFHTHVRLDGPKDADGKPAKLVDGAKQMLRIGRSYNVQLTVTMCPPEDIPLLRDTFGESILFNGHVATFKKGDTPQDALNMLHDYLQHPEVKLLKFWAGPSGVDRGLIIDAPYRLEAARIALDHGIDVIMVHVADPSLWWQRDDKYADTSKYGTKQDQYRGLRNLLETFPNIQWVAAHMAGYPEDPAFLRELLSTYPNLHMDTSATKWQVRECSANRDAIRQLVLDYPDRFLWSTDLVVIHDKDDTHYHSRYWCQRTLWESNWEGQSPIEDPDVGEGQSPPLRGMALPADVAQRVYRDNALRLLKMQ